MIALLQVEQLEAEAEQEVMSSAPRQAIAPKVLVECFLAIVSVDQCDASDADKIAMAACVDAHHPCMRACNTSPHHC